MIVSNLELAGLNSVSGGGHLPGVLLPAYTADDTDEALNGLQAKGVIDDQRRLTDFGYVPVRVVEQYRQAPRHVFINQLKASVNEDGQLTVLHPAPEGWHLSRMAPAALMVMLLKAYPFLRLGSSPADAGPWQPLTRDEWAAAYVREPDAKVMVVRSTSVDEGATHAVAYSTRNRVGYAYDLETQQAQTLPMRDIRARLADLIGFHEPEPPEQGAPHG